MRGRISLYVMTLLLSCFFVTEVRGQSLPATDSIQIQDGGASYRIHSAYMVGGGGSITRDSYLSPLRYGGWTVNLLGEKTFPLRSLSSRLMIRTGHELDFAAMDNPAKNANFYSILYNGSVSALYRLRKGEEWPAWTHNLHIAFGLGVELGIGGIYSTRNGNNPATLKLYTQTLAQGVLGYYIPSETFPLYFRLLTQINLFGLAYGNEFGESYYENFVIDDDLSDSFHFVYPSKLTRFVSLLTVDLPIRDICTVRLGYRYTHFGSSLNGLETKIDNHTVFLGFVTELYRFRGRKAMNSSHRNSLYYHD